MRSAPKWVPVGHRRDWLTILRERGRLHADCVIKARLARIEALERQAPMPDQHEDDLVALVTTDDHARLCQGREYVCTCGYDDRVDAAVKRAATRITDLTRQLDDAKEALRSLLPHVEMARLKEELDVAGGTTQRCPVRQAIRKANAALNPEQTK